MRFGYIVSNEANRGKRLKVRTALLTAGWEEVNPDFIKGSDYGWMTDNKKFVGVQSKTANDFFNSWSGTNQGLLQRELEELIDSCDIPVLLIEEWPMIDRQNNGIRNFYGSLSYNNTMITYTAFCHAFADCIAGLPIGTRIYPLISADMRYSISWLSIDGPKKFDKEDENSGWNRIELNPRNSNKQLQFVSSLEGVGIVNGKELLKEFKTGFGVIDGLRNGLWTKIPGIGRETVSKVLKQLNTEWRVK